MQEVVRIFEETKKYMKKLIQLNYLGFAFGNQDEVLKLKEVKDWVLHTIFQKQ